MDAYNGGSVSNFVSRLIPELGFLNAFLFGDNGDCHAACNLCDKISLQNNVWTNFVVQMLEMWRPVPLHLQLECGLGHGIAVHSLGLLVVLQIRLGSSACIYALILSNTVIILHYEFLYLQPQVFFYVSLWFHKSQGTWFDQIARTCALVRQVTAQLIQFDSSAGDLSYKYVILMLIPSLGYHSEILLHLIVPLYVHAAAISSERELTVQMATRTRIHLAESVLWRLNSYVMLFVKTGDCDDIGYLSVEKAQRNTVYQSTSTSLLRDTFGGLSKRGAGTDQFLCHSWLLSIGCFYLSFAYTRTLFDRGKDFEVSMWNSCCVTWDFGFAFVSYVGLNLVDKWHRGILHELVSKIGYRSDWLFSASIPYVSAMSGAETLFLVLKCNLPELQPIRSPHPVFHPLNACSVYFDPLLMTSFISSIQFPAQSSNTRPTSCRRRSLYSAQDAYGLYYRGDYYKDILVRYLRLKITAYSSAQFYCVLIVFAMAVTRYHQKVAIWLAKGYLRIQFLGVRVMVGKLAYFFVSAAKLVFPTVPEFIILAPGEVSNIQIRSGANAHCTEERLLQLQSPWCQLLVLLLRLQHYRREFSADKKLLLNCVFWRYTHVWISCCTRYDEKRNGNLVLILEDKDVFKQWGMSCTRYDEKRVSLIPFRVGA